MYKYLCNDCLAVGALQRRPLQNPWRRLSDLIGDCTASSCYISDLANKLGHRLLWRQRSSNGHQEEKVEWFLPVTKRQSLAYWRAVQCFIHISTPWSIVITQLYRGGCFRMGIEVRERKSAHNYRGACVPLNESSTKEQCRSDRNHISKLSNGSSLLIGGLSSDNNNNREQRPRVSFHNYECCPLRYSDKHSSFMFYLCSVHTVWPLSMQS